MKIGIFMHLKAMLVQGLSRFFQGNNPVPLKGGFQKEACELKILGFLVCFPAYSHRW